MPSAFVVAQRARIPSIGLPFDRQHLEVIAAAYKAACSELACDDPMLRELMARRSSSLRNAISAMRNARTTSSQPKQLKICRPSVL